MGDAGLAELVAVAVIVAVAATVQLAAGFGFALAATPGLAVVLGAREAVVVTLFVATFTNGYQAWSGRRATDRPIVGRMLAGAALGLPVGLLVYLVISERWLQAVIGVAVLVAVVLIGWGIDLRHAGRWLDVGSGVVCGTMTTSTGINGPPLVFALTARRLTPDAFRSTITTVFFILDFVSVVAFAIAGEVGRDVLVAVVASLPGQVAGAAFGLRLRRHLDERRLRLLVLALLTIAGVAALLSAARPR